MRVPHFAPCWHDYYATKVFIRIIIAMEVDQHVNKLTYNEINYTDHFVVTFLHCSYLLYWHYA